MNKQTWNSAPPHPSGKCILSSSSPSHISAKSQNKEKLKSYDFLPHILKNKMYCCLRKRVVFTTPNSSTLHSSSGNKKQNKSHFPEVQSIRQGSGFPCPLLSGFWSWPHWKACALISNTKRNTQFDEVHMRSLYRPMWGKKSSQNPEISFSHLWT